MSVNIYNATQEDAISLAQCNIEAFRDDPVHHALFNRSDEGTQESHEAEVTFRKQAFEHHLRKPNVHIFKAVDDSTGYLIGFAVWDGPSATDNDPNDKEAILDSVPSVFSRELIEQWLACITQTRLDLMGDRTDYWHLTNIGVSSRYQKQGIAQRLLEQGLKLADEQNSDAYLESSIVAEKLYARNSFEVLRRIEPIKGLWATTMVRRARPRDP